MKVKVISNNKEASLELKNEVFAVKASDKLIAQVVNRNLANLRQLIAHTKNRGDVSGGGRKPWRQKGTGNARAGSSRSPLWRGGGVTFGPRNVQNFSKRINRKMATTALKMALSEKIAQKRLIITDLIKLTDISTKKLEKQLFSLPIENGSILFVLAKTDINLELSAKNLPYLKTIQAAGLNLIDVLKYDYIVMDKDAVKAIENLFTGKKETEEEVKPAKKETGVSEPKKAATPVKKTSPKPSKVAK